MKQFKITATNHDKSKSEIALIRNENDARRTIKLMRDSGYKTIKSEEI